ncbi:hypothetical protein [Pseudoalteromonas spongiae]|uniref:hypothetical protein n=1 Tax=Pseudoalteromonas spongiae TaxID=298657 RepID=UPI0012FD8B6C|nr:hypothetical protein [Pseudoalteromonas spongiae]
MSSISIKLGVIDIVVLAFDLKTGKGMGSRRNKRLKQRFDGVDIVEIMVWQKK